MYDVMVQGAHRVYYNYNYQYKGYSFRGFFFSCVKQAFRLPFSVCDDGG